MYNKRHNNPIKPLGVTLFVNCKHSHIGCINDQQILFIHFVLYPMGGAISPRLSTTLVKEKERDSQELA